MPTELRDNQHELLLPDGSVSIVFGTEDTKYLTLSYPTIEAGDATLGDQPRVREDGVAFGEDFLGSKTETFEIGVITDRNMDPHLAGADALGTLEGVWKHRRFRERSTSYGILRTQLSTRTVRCYGRPRRYAETAQATTNRGYTPVIADFQVIDGRWYDDHEQQVDASLVPAVVGGFVAPFVAPLTLISVTTGKTTMTVGGTDETWPVVEFHGPVSNPEVTIGDLVIGLTGDVPFGMVTTVDPRPWSRSVKRSDGANQSGKVSWATPPLRTCLLAPGKYEVAYRGTDVTGTSTCRVRWRNARPRP